MKCVRCSTASDNVELEKILEYIKSDEPKYTFVPFQVNLHNKERRNYDGYECPNCGEFSWIRNKEHE